MTAMDLFKLSLPAGSRVCLVGGRAGELAELHNYQVTNHDYHTNKTKYEAAPQRPEMYDGLYCAHTLEHMRNVGVVLDKMFNELKTGGLLCLVVPPAKPEIVGGHLSIWNAGLLLYNLIRAHFDCSKAAVKTYGYNVAVLVRKQNAPYQDITMLEDDGDIELLSRYFPIPARQNFDGRIEQWNWKIR